MELHNEVGDGAVDDIVLLISRNGQFSLSFSLNTAQTTIRHKRMEITQISHGRILISGRLGINRAYPRLPLPAGMPHMDKSRNPQRKGEEMRWHRTLSPPTIGGVSARVPGVGADAAAGSGGWPPLAP